MDKYPGWSPDEVAKARKTRLAEDVAKARKANPVVEIDERPGGRGVWNAIINDPDLVQEDDELIHAFVYVYVSTEAGRSLPTPGHRHKMFWWHLMDQGESPLSTVLGDLERIKQKLIMDEDFDADDYFEDEG